MDGKKNGWMDGQKKKEKIDGWLDGQKKYMKKMDGWMDKKIDGWLDG